MRHTFLLILACATAATAADPMISEFMAANTATIADEDGDASDWIEIYNPGPDTVNLAGWYLTDDPEALDAWSFPSVSLPSNGYLLVFASGKNRRDPAGEIHTSFRLNADGDYLALVKPDATTIAYEFGPTFPSQRADYSFGTGQRVTVTSIVPSRAPLRVLIPQNDLLSTTWTGGNEPFNHTTWTSGTSGVGYVTMVPGFLVRNCAGNTGVCDLPTAELVVSDPAYQSSVAIENTAVVDFLGTGDSGHYTALETAFPGTVAGQDNENFAILATAIVTIPSAGAWTFGVQSDDGFGLDLTRGATSFRIEYPAPRGPGDTVGTFNITTPGEYELRLVMYECGGGSMVELFAAQGTYTSWNSNFKLVGDTASGGLAVMSEVADSDTEGGFRTYIGTDIQTAMLGVRSSAYVRIPFNVVDPGAYENLFLRVRYDDGFVAYLNGVEVARRNAPATLAYNSRAVANRPAEDALRNDDISITESIGLLRAGANILAFHGLNDTVSSTDFLLCAELAQIKIESMVPGYFDTPTPGQPNALGFVDFVRDTHFSIDRGFYSEAFDVELTTLTPGAQIRYTLDGKRPTATTGLVYATPLHIAKTTCLRAAAFKENCIPTNVDTQTYIFLDDVIRQSYQATINAGFPSSWGGTTPDYGMDPDVIGQTGPDRYAGKYAATIKDDLMGIPTMSIVLPTDDLFGASGIYTNSGGRGLAYERATSVELIYPDGTPGFQEDCGLRMQGGAFRSHGLTLKHSFRLIFKATYGATKLRYPLFGPGAPDRFDCVILRANANDGYSWDAYGGRVLYIRDTFMRYAALDMGSVAGHDTFVHLYINGYYWGLYNPVERPDSSFSSTYFGGDKDNWDIITQYDVVQHGNGTAWNAMLSLCSQGLATDTAYFRIQGRNSDGTPNPAIPNYLDVENYADYMICNLYGGNTDWPHNNWRAARDRENGAGFKFYIWDAEWVMGIGSELGTNQVNVSANIAAPWAALRQNAEFRMLVADRIHKYFFNGGPLAVNAANPGWNPLYPERNRPAQLFMRFADFVDRAMVAESARWGDMHSATPYTHDEHWLAERNNLLANYFPQRSAIVVQQFRNASLYPTVQAPVFNQHGGAIEPGFELIMTAPAGRLYYTLDGADPRLRGGAVAPSALVYADASNLTLVPEDAAGRVLVPVNDALGLTWTAYGFNDAAWTAGTMGVGFETSTGYQDYLGTDLRTSMYNINGTVYIRIPFQVENPGLVSELTLGMRYDDGFVAYINGQQVAARNAPASPTWNSIAIASNPDSSAIQFEAITLTGAAAYLRAGTNVLAIHGMNQTNGSSDMLIEPTLNATTTLGGQGIPLGATTFVRTRALYNGTWSALNEAVFHVFRPLDALRITEVMYHPPDEELVNGDVFEFIELKNTGAATLDLSGVRFMDGVTFTFPEGSVLDAGDFIVLVADYAAFQSKYPTVTSVFGVYDGNLSNGGERIALADPDGNELVAFTYDDAPPWPAEADGLNTSIVPLDPSGAGDPDSFTYWSASGVQGGSPGADDPGNPGAGGWQRQGDINQDSKLDISDAVGLLRVLFAGASVPLPCEGSTVNSGGNLTLLDLNADQGVDIADAIYMLAYLFQHGTRPALGTTCVRIVGCPHKCY